MTNRVFEDANSFEVSSKGCDVEVYVFNTTDRSVNIQCIEEAGWDSQRVTMNITAEEATKLKQFLIAQGY